MAILGDPLTSSGDAVDSPIESPSSEPRDGEVTHSRSERQLRRLAVREGVRLVTDRTAQRAGLGGYALVDWEGGEIMLGGGMPNPSCDLDEIESWLLTPAAVRATWWES